MAIPFEEYLISSCTAMHFVIKHRDRFKVLL